MVRVKICGNRNFEDVTMAMNAGADGIGLISGIRHFSEDVLDEIQCIEILTRIPPFVSSVLVTHLIDAESVLELYKKVPTSTIQLHDVIPTEEVIEIRRSLKGVKIIKGIHVIDEGSILDAKKYEDIVDALLLDSSTKDRIGGTGQVHNWSISRRIVASVRKPVILAGGLNPRNVQDAISHVQPYGVDVNSGVEFANGEKDPHKVAEFIRLAKI